jgi:hypothetical protein
VIEWSAQHPLLTCILIGWLLEIALPKRDLFLENHALATIIALGAVYVWFFVEFVTGSLTVKLDTIAPLLFKLVDAAALRELGTIIPLTPNYNVQGVWSLTLLALYFGVVKLAGANVGKRRWNILNPLLLPFVTVWYAGIGIVFGLIYFFIALILVYGLAAVLSFLGMTEGVVVRGIATVFFLLVFSPVFFACAGLFNLAGKGIFVYNLGVLVTFALSREDLLSHSGVQTLFQALSAGVLGLVNPEGIWKIALIVVFTVLTVFGNADALTRLFTPGAKGA